MKHRSLHATIIAAALLSILFFAGSSAFYVAKFDLNAPGVGLFDDAFMFVRYADNFIAGLGFSWNAGDGLAYGCTSMLYLFLVAAGRMVYTASDAILLMSLSLLFTLGAVITLLFLTKRVLRDAAALPAGLYLLILPAFLLSYSARFHAFTGMETSLALFGNSIFLLALFWYGKKQSIPLLLLLLAAAYVSYISRPDNGLYLLLTPPLYLWQFAGINRKKILVFPICFAAIIILDLFIKYNLFGSMLPFGYYAKQRGFYNGFIGAENSAEGLMFFLRDSAAPFILLSALFIRRSDIRKFLLLLIPAAISFLYFLSVVQIMGGIGRYYYPALPFFVFAAALIVKDRFAGPGGEGITISLKRAVAVTFVLLTITSTGISNAAKSLEAMIVKAPVNYSPATKFSTAAGYALPPAHNEEIIYYSIRDVTEFLQKLPGGITLAATEHGLLGARLPQITIIDLMGLHDRNIVKEGFSGNYLFRRKPDLIWFPHYNYTFHVKEIIDHPVFFTDYEYYPKLYRFGLALRKDSIYFGEMKRKLEEEFARLYPGLRLDNFLAIKIHQ